MSESLYTHLLFLASSYFADSQIRGVASRIKIYRSDPSMGKNNKNVQQLEEIFETYRMIFTELSEKNQQLPSQGFCTGEEKLKKKLRSYGRAL